MVRPALLLVVAAVGCAGAHGTNAKPQHAPANFDPSFAGLVACSRLIVEGDVVRVTPTYGSRMITELTVDKWLKPSTGPKVARIETVDIAAQGVYDHWQPGQHLFLLVDADPTALPDWQFEPEAIREIKAAIPDSRKLDCPYGVTDLPLLNSS